MRHAAVRVWGSCKRVLVLPESALRAVASWPLRTGLLAGCAVSMGIAVYLGDPGPLTHSDPSLARLLRGMALIKGVMAIAAVAAVWWRLGRPVSMPLAAAYLMGSWILAGSTMLVWQLSWIPLAAILFHAAALSMLCLTFRHRRVSPNTYRSVAREATHGGQA